MVTKEEETFWESWAVIGHHSLPKLREWEANSNREYHCVFCSRHGSESNFRRNSLSILCCPKCREYKGIEPCLKGELNCQL